MNWKAFVPNTITLLNLCCGFVAIICAFQEKLEYTAIFMVLGAVLDFFDGMTARALGVTGELGKQLDSLADVVTFGVAPGVIFFQMISISMGLYYVPLVDRDLSGILIPSVALIMPALSALRLAIFNLSEDQTFDFIGMPTPANAMLWASFPLMFTYQIGLNMYTPAEPQVLATLLSSPHHYDSDIYAAYYLFDKNYIIPIGVLMSLFLVSPIRFISFKFKSKKWSDSWHKYLFLLSIIVLVTWFGIEDIWLFSVPVIYLFYILLSIIYTFINRKNEVQS